MKLENGYIYGAGRKEVIELIISLDDGVSYAKYVNENMAQYELESLYMKLTGTNYFN